MLLLKNKGSCSEKHLFLGREFRKLGISVRYLTMTFDWRTLPVPKEIINKKDSPIGGHLALKIKLGGKWMIVDAAWDPGLEKAGFPVTKSCASAQEMNAHLLNWRSRNWDGRRDTKLAVKPMELQESEKPPPEQIKRTENREFYDALNKWMEKQR